jgi:hypothetical protein
VIHFPSRCFDRRVAGLIHLGGIRPVAKPIGLVIAELITDFTALVIAKIIADLIVLVTARRNRKCLILPAVESDVSCLACLILLGRRSHRRRGDSMIRSRERLVGTLGIAGTHGGCAAFSIRGTRRRVLTKACRDRVVLAQWVQR